MCDLGGESVRQIIQEELSNNRYKKKSVAGKIGSVFGFGWHNNTTSSSSVLGERPVRENKMIQTIFYLSDIKPCTNLRKGGIESGIRQYLHSNIATYKYITGKIQRILEGGEQKVRLVLRGYEDDINKIEKDILHTKDGHWTLTVDRDNKEYVPLDGEIFQILPSASRTVLKSDDSPDDFEYKSVASSKSSQK